MRASGVVFRIATSARSTFRIAYVSRDRRVVAREAPNPGRRPRFFRRDPCRIIDVAILVATLLGMFQGSFNSLNLSVRRSLTTPPACSPPGRAAVQPGAKCREDRISIQSRWINTTARTLLETKPAWLIASLISAFHKLSHIPLPSPDSRGSNVQDSAPPVTALRNRQLEPPRVRAVSCCR